MAPSLTSCSNQKCSCHPWNHSLLLSIHHQVTFLFLKYFWKPTATLCLHYHSLSLCHYLLYLEDYDSLLISIPTFIHSSTLIHIVNDHLKILFGTSLVVQQLRLHGPNAGGLGSIPGQGLRSCMLQLKIPHMATKIPRAATKTWCSQINKYLKNKKIKIFSTSCHLPA